MCTVTPIAIAELLRLLDQHVPQLLRPLAEAAVRAEHEREELDADRLALVEVDRVLEFLALLDGRLESEVRRLGTDKRDVGHPPRRARRTSMAGNIHHRVCRAAQHAPRSGHA